MNTGKNKVLLLYPAADSEQYSQIPLSLLYVAQPLLDDGIAVEILDQRLEKNFFDSIHRHLTPDLICVGISCITGPAVAQVIKSCELIKQATDTPIVLGGPHATLFPEQTLAYPLIDCVVLGRGEEPFLNLVRALKGGLSPGQIVNIGYRDRDKIAIQKGPASFPEPRDIPYHLLAHYAVPTTIPVITSWGCPFRCTFCVERVLHPTFYQLPPADVLKTVEAALRFKPRFISFFDDNFLLDIKRVVALFSLFREKGDIFQWVCTGRVDVVLSLDQETLRFLKNSGLTAIFFGIESGSPEMLKLINKGITPDMAVRLNLKMREEGITPHYSFMAGFPGETQADLRMTMTLMERLKADNPQAFIWKINQYTPYPGTEMYDLAVEHGYHPPRKLEEWTQAYFYSREFNTPYDARL